MTARVELIVKYDGVDIAKDISDYLTSFRFTDNISGKADDLSISLEDVRGLWRSDWFPQKGAKLEVGLKCFDWYGTDTVETVPFGSFTIDEISVSGSPDVVQLSAVSTFTSHSFKGEQKNRVFEHVTLKAIAETYASEHGFKLFFESGHNPEYIRKEQIQESDLNFMKRICEDAGLNIKVSDEQLIIFSAVDYDKRPPAYKLNMNSGQIKRWSFKSKAHDIFKACHVKYYHPAKAQELTYKYEPVNAPPVGQIYVVNEGVDSLSEAQFQARYMLHKKNKNEATGTLDLYGMPEAAAGQNVDLSGFGNFDGVYAIDKVTHTINSGGYSTSLEVRRILPGWD